MNVADDWSARAHTRPGYATYADTPAGDPTSPHRPPTRPGHATRPDRRQAEDAIVDKLIAAADEDQLAHTSLHELRDQAAELVDRIRPADQHGALPPLPDDAYPPDAEPLPPFYAFNEPLSAADQIIDTHEATHHPGRPCPENAQGYCAEKPRPDRTLASDEAELLAALIRAGMLNRPAWWRRTLRRITRRS